MSDGERKPLAETHPHLKDFLAFLDELNKESARGAVLVSCAMLDDLLGQIVRSFLLEHRETDAILEGRYAPLGSFSARASAALLLGLISEREFDECERLRKVRNLFAHDVHVSFDDTRIRDRCGNLTFAAKDYDDVKVGPRGQFTSAVVSLILNLTNRPHYVARERRQSKPWPY